VSGDAGALGKLARTLLIARVIRRDLHSHVLEGDADRLANAARPAGDDRHSSHDSLSCCKSRARLGAGQPACKLTLDQAFEHVDAFGRIVEAFEKRELFAARSEEGVAASDAKFLKRFDAIS